MRKGCGHWTFQRCDCLIRWEETNEDGRKVTRCVPIFRKTRADESAELTGYFHGRAHI